MCFILEDTEEKVKSRQQRTLGCAVPVLTQSIMTSVIKDNKSWTNEALGGVRQREDGPTRPDGNKSLSGTEEEVTGQAQAK